jgi:hypothetical protein
MLCGMVHLTDGISYTQPPMHSCNNKDAADTSMARHLLRMCAVHAPTPSSDQQDALTVERQQVA